MDKVLEQQLSACKSLPSPPAVALKVVEMARSSDCGAADISRIISRDPALTAKILSIANSPIYALRRKAENLRQALTYLGLDATLTLVLSFSLAKSLISKELKGMDHHAFWRRSLISAIASRTLGEEQGLADTEKLFLAGLLQDIGILALNEVATERYGKVFHQAQDHDQLGDLERREFGVDHTEVGAWLLRQWGLPSFYAQAIQHSHCIFPAPDQEQADDYRCLALSGLLADIWTSDNQQLATTRAASLLQQQLGITTEQLHELINRINDRIPEIASLFELDMGQTLDPLQLMNAAKELLVSRNLKLLQDISHYRREMEKTHSDRAQLERQLRIDSLSGLYNRAYLEHALEQEFQAAQEQRHPLTIAFIDLDYFKQINDRFGHHIGDRTIQAMGKVLQGSVRSTDIVGRYGGEEFMVILPGEGSEGGVILAKRLHAKLNHTPLLRHENIEIRVTASIGIATYQTGHKAIKTKEDLVVAADRCMYASKQQGRNRITVY